MEGTSTRQCSVPIELIDLIAAEIPLKRDLRALSHTCRAVHNLVLARIYRDIRLENPNWHAVWKDLTRDPTLACSVRQLTVVSPLLQKPPSRGTRGRLGDAPKFDPPFAQVLQRMVHLELLTIEAGLPPDTERRYQDTPEYKYLNPTSPPPRPKPFWTTLPTMDSLRCLNLTLTCNYRGMIDLNGLIKVCGNR